MRLIGVLSVIALLLVVPAGATPAYAQQDSDTDEPADTAAVPEDEQKEKKPFSLYVEVSYGETTADPLNTSVATTSTDISHSSLEFDQTWTKSAIGWKLPKGKGDFRIVYSGYKEDGYSFQGTGLASAFIGVVPAAVAEPLPWWSVSVENGVLSASRTPPNWNVATDDTDGDGVVDPDEVNFPVTDIEHEILVTDDLQNQLQFVDFLYGREFGGRRFNGRWWAGVRKFAYEGNVLASAWLGADGYTDGTTLRLLNFAQETDGVGLTSAIESRFNFFEDRLTLYLGSQIAFLVMDLEVDSGTFFTWVEANNLLIPAEARLTTTRDKDSWQTMAEAGVRYKLANGVTFDLAYNISGFLDVIIAPPQIQIPGNLNEAVQGTTAIYNTQDIVTDGGRFGVSFQF